MQDEFYERQKRLIEGDNINVSETNVIKELVKILINLALILACIYFSVFIISGIIIKNIPLEKQIALENFLAKIVDEKNAKDLEGDDAKKINYIKNKILQYDKDFPKTSKLDIKIINSYTPNALCLPNGNIYITSELYNKIKDDDILFFIIAHEMAHYKNRDHIMNLRKNIASAVVIILVSFAGNNQNDLSSLVEGTMDLSDLNYSRSTEARADKYAAEMLLREYGSVKGGIKTFELLSDKQYPEIFGIFSTHPTIKKRISNLKKMEK